MMMYQAFASDQRRDTFVVVLFLSSSPLDSCAAQRYYNGFANNVLWPLFHYIMSSAFRTADSFSFL